MDTFLKDKLQPALNQICKRVYKLMQVKNQEFIQIRQIPEDGISSIILKDLVDLNSSEIVVKAKSLDVQESITGIDFDLWIGESDKKYIRLLIQAKSYRNNTSTEGTYNSVKLDQCEKLLKEVKSQDYGLDKYRPLPLYFFYQHINSGNVCNDFFSFDENLRPEDVSVTFASAMTVRKIIQDDSIRYDELHKNEIVGRYTSDLSIFDILDLKDKNICLPLTSLSDLSIQMVEKFIEIKKTSPKNSMGFFFFLPIDYNDSPLEIHTISSSEILKLYDDIPKTGHRIKNVVILDDHQFDVREKVKKRKNIIKELTK